MLEYRIEVLDHTIRCDHVDIYKPFPASDPGRVTRHECGGIATHHVWEPATGHAQNLCPAHIAPYLLPSPASTD
jgi:hypothetical protein